jgi:hypothetical protein
MRLALVPVTRDFPPTSDRAAQPGIALCDRDEHGARLHALRRSLGKAHITRALWLAGADHRRTGGHAPFGTPGSRVGNPVAWVRPVADPNRMVPIAIGTDHGVNIAQRLSCRPDADRCPRAVGVRAMSKFTGIVGGGRRPPPARRDADHGGAASPFLLTGSLPWDIMFVVRPCLLPDRRLVRPAVPAHAQSWAESWFDNVTYTSPGSFEDQTRGYVTAGGMSGRVDVHDDYLMSLSLPKVKAGCGGIDMFLGGMSFLDPDYLVQKLETILQAAPAVAFQYLLETLDEKMGNIISKMEAATNFLNSIQVNDCRLANRMVQIAKGDDNMSGIVEEMTGYKSIREGYAKSWQQSREKIQSNKGNPTEDLKDALANCPAEVTDIFKTGSLLAHAAARVGASDWAGVMRARVGDVYMRWDANDKVPCSRPSRLPAPGYRERR